MTRIRPSKGRFRARAWLLGLGGVCALGAATSLSGSPVLWSARAPGPPEPEAGSQGGFESDEPRQADAQSAAESDFAATPRTAPARWADAATGARPAALWELSGDSVHPFDHPIGDYRPERHALRVDSDRTRGLAVGDRIELPLPGMGTLVATIEHVETTALGNRSLTGSLDGLDPAYAVTLTQGHMSLFGRITTPYGNYLLEGMGGAAAIHLDDLDQLIDPDRTDERIPPEAGEEPA